MKVSSVHLFDLIKSLTNSEKRYFTLYLQRHYTQENNSLKLFQALNNQVQYNEADAIKETGLAKNNFAVQKNILYDQLLTSLSQFDLAGSLLQQVQQQVFACQKLLQKGLLAQASTKLKQLQADVGLYQLHEVSLQAMNLESALQARQQYKHTTAKNMDTWYKEIAILTEKIQIEAYCKNINNKAQKIQIEAGGKGKAFADAVKELLESVKTKTSGSHLTVRAEMDILQTEALYHFMDQDTVNAQKINARFIALMESDKHWIQFYPQRYFSALNNYLIDCFQLKKEKELREGLDKMRSLKGHSAFKKTINLEPNIFRTTYQIELNYLISEGQFSRALPIVPVVKEGLEKYKAGISINHRMNMQYLCAYILFGNGKYAEASDQLDIIQQQNKNETATILDNVVSIMQIICHFEMRNYSIIDSLVKSTKRKLANQKTVLSTGPEFEFLNGLLSFSSKKPDLKDWIKLSDKLKDTMTTNPAETSYKAYLDYIVYVKAKSLKLDFESAWKEKTNDK